MLGQYASTIIHKEHQGCPTPLLPLSSSSFLLQEYPSGRLMKNPSDTLLRKNKRRTRLTGGGWRHPEVQSRVPPPAAG